MDSKSMPKKPTIIYDDREKYPWTAETFGPGFLTERRRLATGDYTLEGYESVLCIERKHSWEEIAQNVSNNRSRIRFRAMLKRMQSYPVRMLILEDSYTRLPFASSHSGHIGVKELCAWSMELLLEYGIPIVPIGSSTSRQARIIVRGIFQSIPKLQKEGRLYHANKDK